MKNRIINLTVLLFVLLAGLAIPNRSGIAIAQENDQGTPPAQVGPYRFGGDLTFGYRSFDVKGLTGRTSDDWAQRLFHEQYQTDPTKGLPVFDLNLFGEKPQGGEGFFDQLFLNTSYDGGNFLGSLRVRQFGSYDLKVNFTQSAYYYDHFDSIYTDLHQFDQKRTRLNASLTITPASMLDINLQYSGNSRKGDLQTTRSPALEYGGATEPLQTGPYARANFFWMNAPIDDKTSQFQGSITARLPMTTISAGGGYRSFTQDPNQTPEFLTSLNNIGDSAKGYVNDGGIIGTSKLKEPLKTFSWLEHRESKGPFAFGEIVFKPIDMLSATASVNFQSIDGNATVNAAQTGLMRLSSTGNIRDYQASWNGASEEALKRLNASLTVALRPMNGLQILAGFQHESKKQSTTSKYVSTLDTAKTGTPLVFVKARKDSLVTLDDSVEYDVPVNTIMGDVFYAPMQNLSLRAGVRYAMRDPLVTKVADGALDEGVAADLSEKTNTMTVKGNVYYRPIEQIRLRAGVESTTRNISLDNPTSLLERTDLENPTLTPRRTLKNDLVINGSIDADPTDKLSVSVWGSVGGGKNDLLMRMLNPLATVADSLKTTLTLGPADLVNVEERRKSLSGSISYQLPMNTSISVTGNYQEYKFSIPVIFRRVTGGVNGYVPIKMFTPDTLGFVTVLNQEHTIDRTLGFSASTNPIEGLTVMLGFNYLRSTGSSSLTSDVTDWAKLYAATVTATGDLGQGYKAMGGDFSRQNGPMTRWEGRASAQYFFMKNIGVGVDAVFANQTEDLVQKFVALNNFKAMALTFSLAVKL